MFITALGKKSVKTITITSGKGGVGKTNLAANLAIAMRKLGRRVMIVDADFGLSNIEVLLNLAPKFNIQHVLKGGMALRDVVVEGPHGVQLLSAGSGVQELTTLDEFQRLKILEAFAAYQSDIDVLLIDTAAGISDNVAFFCVAAQEIVVVTSSEPTAVADACALIKVLCTRYQEKEFHVLVNSVKSPEEAMEAFRRLSLATEKFLSVSLDYLGYLPYDGSVASAVRAQRPFIDMYPRNEVSRRIMKIAKKFLGRSDKVKGTLQFFIGNPVSAPAGSGQ
jgi:flagellar biosynthesis protein FlhG